MAVTVAADIMQAAVTVRAKDDLRAAAQALLKAASREMPVVADEGRILGFLDEADIARAFLDATKGQ